MQLTQSFTIATRLMFFTVFRYCSLVIHDLTTGCQTDTQETLRIINLKQVFEAGSNILV